MNQEAAGAGNEQERLTYRHGSYAAAFVMMKRLRGAIAADPVLDSQKLVAAVGPELDNLRQRLWAETRPLTVGRNPLNLFKTQADVSGIIRSMMTEHYGLQTNQALPPLLALPIGNDP